MRFFITSKWDIKEIGFKSSLNEKGINEFEIDAWKVHHAHGGKVSSNESNNQCLRIIPLAII